MTGIDDPGVKGQIFEGMTKNVKGLMEVNGEFLTINPMVKCDSSWQQNIYHNLKSFIKTKTTGSLIGFDSSVGKDLHIPYRPSLSLPITVIFKMPTFLSRTSSLDDKLIRLSVFQPKNPFKSRPKILFILYFLYILQRLRDCCRFLSEAIFANLAIF